MSFQDLLKQPLPSQMGDDFMMEAANPAKIAADVMDLNKTYKASTKAIKEKIASVRNAMKDSKFKAALNIINNCRKDVINDRNEISKRIKAIESAGLNKNTIRGIMAGTAIAGGAKIAYDVKKSSDLKNEREDAAKKREEAFAKSRKYRIDAEIAKNQRDDHIRRKSEGDNKKYHQLNEKINGEIYCLKQTQQSYDDYHRMAKDAYKSGEISEKEFKRRKQQNEMKRREAIAAAKRNINKYNEEIKKIINKDDVNINDRDAADEKYRKASQIADMYGAQVLASSYKSHAANEKLAAHKSNAIKTGSALAAAGGVTYATIKLFMLIKDNYEKYYDGVQKTLDELEDKCEKKSQDVKECLVDFVNLTYDMEMLMESVESEDDFDESIEFESAYDDFDDEDDIEEDIDISDMSDADLDELEDELTDSDIEDEMDDDDDEEVDLTPEEEREADDYMSLAATTELVRDELSATERAEFYSDPVQAQIAVLEGFMLESDFQDGDMVTEKFFNKTRVQFSKEDRKRQLFSVALNASARAHNDPDYIKLQKVQQMRRVLKARIRKKYRGEALRRVKVYMQRLKASKSGVLAKIGEKLHRDNKD